MSNTAIPLLRRELPAWWRSTADEILDLARTNLWR